MGIESYPSPTIGTDRKSNLSLCFRQSFCSLSIADNRGSVEIFETAVSVRGGRHYLFRAVDKNGKSIGSLLCNDRNKESAQAFFRAVVADGRVPWPKKINIDGNKATLRGLELLGKEIPAGGKWKCVHGDISTMWLSKTIGPSNSDALRC